MTNDKIESYNKLTPILRAINTQSNLIAKQAEQISQLFYDYENCSEDIYEDIIKLAELFCKKYDSKLYNKAYIEKVVK